MKCTRAHVLVIPREKAAGLLVDDHKARRIWPANLDVGIVHAVAAIQIQMIAVDENGTVRGVVGPNAGASGKIERPDDVRIERAGFDGWLPGNGLMSSLVPKRAVVAIRHSVHIKAEDFAAIADDIDAIALDGGRRRNAAVWPIEKRVFCALRYDELPQEMTVVLIETHQDAAIALVPRVARFVVVCADKDAATRHDGSGVGFSAELCAPLDILATGEIEMRGQSAFFGNKVARPCLAPLRLVGSEQRANAQQQREKGACVHRVWPAAASDTVSASSAEATRDGILISWIENTGY